MVIFSDFWKLEFRINEKKIIQFCGTKTYQKIGFECKNDLNFFNSMFIFKRIVVFFA